MNRDLDYVLNYMKQYVENKYEHDSEPMLNYKDLELVLDYIKNLNGRIEALNQIIQEQDDKILWQNEHI